MAQQMPRPPSPGSSSLEWAGDGTLHSYCYDYMRKRGWTETASAFAADAGINEDEWKGPPIEAPQGLLYEWWSVFWDVFIARSQKTGQRNASADSFVEAMRKRDPLVVHFTGANPQPPIALPRSYTQQGRPTPLPHGPGPRANYTNPSQMHVLEQQQLQQQMQQGRAPIQGQRPINGAPPQAQYHGQPPSSQAGGPPGPQHAGGPPPPGPPPHSQHPQHSQAPPLPQQQQAGAPYPASGIPQPLLHPYNGPPAPGPPGPPGQQPQSSPHLAHAQHRGPPGPPGGGGPPGPPPPPPMRQASMQEIVDVHSPIYAQAMSVIGLDRRDPESLHQDDHNAVIAQMRRMGAFNQGPPQGQPAHMRPQQGRVVTQRIHPDQQRQMSGQYPPQGMQGRGPPQQPPPMQQQQQQQQHMMQMQQQQQQRDREQHFAQQAQQQRMQQGGPPMQPHPDQMQYGNPPRNMTSPAYSGASPYATPLAQHLTIPPGSQASPPPAFPPPLPPPSRAASTTKARGNANAKMSPAAAKRGGNNLEDPSPRSRKRARGATKDDEMMNVGGGPETPNFDGSGPSSPGGMMPNGQMYPGGPVPPYRPSPSPSQMQDPSSRGALDAMQMNNNARMLHQQQQQQMNHQLNMRNETMFSGPPPPGEHYMDGGPMNGHGMNGTISRPGSSASNYLTPGAANNNGYGPPGSQHDPNRPSPGPSPHPASPMHITLPPPLPPNTIASGMAMGHEMTTPGGTTRPFAGAPQSSHPTPSQATSPLPPPPQQGQQQPPLLDLVVGGASANGSVAGGDQFNGSGGGSGGAPTPGPANGGGPPAGNNGTTTTIPGDQSFQFNTSGEDMYADLSLDFAFDSFIDGDLFKDETGV